MKKFITVLMFISLISCSLKSNEEKVEYNKEAVDLNNQAAKYFAFMQYDSALIFYDKAIQADEKYYIPHSGKTSVYIAQEKYDKALLESKMVIKKKPNLAEGWVGVGLVYERLNNSEKAKEYYKKSIELFSERINNKKDINDNLLNRAFSKILINDSTYKDDLKHLENNANYKSLVEMLSKTTKDKLLKDFFNQ